jgi:hypothetical protein
MKKLTSYIRKRGVLLVLFLLPLFTMAQKTYVPDDNFENWLEISGYGDGIVNNDSVLTANINTLTVLEVFMQNISDLTGVEDFVSLVELNCSGNNLTTLNLSTLNNLTNLTELNCSFNSISFIDVNTQVYQQLEWFYCDNNNLSFIEITPIMWVVRCVNNNLTYLPYFGGSLISLTCDGNNLTELDLSNAFYLSSVSCRDNSLISLDISTGNMLTYFLYLDATYNPQLECVIVDDPVWATTNFLASIPQTSFYSEDCIYSKVRGEVYYDTDSNFTHNISEYGVANQVLQLTDGNGVVSFTNTNNNGEYKGIIDSTMSYTLTYNAMPYYIETSNTVNYNFANISPDSITDLDYGIYPSTTQSDVGIYLSSTPYIANSNAYIYVDIINHSSDTVSGIYDLWVDPSSNIINTTNSPTIVSNQISWSFNSLLPQQSEQQVVEIQIPLLLWSGLTDSATITPSLISPAVELSLSNNYDEISNGILFSYDPNDKQVMPKQCYYASEDTMEFTVRFQNTGNYPASSVRIIDTLDCDILDVENILFLGSSHDYSWTFRPPAILDILFDNINLVDSSVSYLESQGYVKYQINFKDNINEMSKYEQSAYIYFDLNPPIITNEPAVYYSNDFDVSILQNDTLLESNIISGLNPFNYSWSNGDSSQNITIQNSGAYWLVVTDSVGCSSDTISYTVTINNIYESQNKNKTLLKVIDILGRNTKGIKNAPLLYIYSDGTVEKKLIIE